GRAEAAPARVLEERAAAARRAAPAQLAALHEERVDVAVAVRVDERRAPTNDLGHPEGSGVSRGVREDEPARRGALLEPRLARALLRQTRLPAAARERESGQDGDARP